MKIVVFESAAFHDLYPLTFLRPVFELRCGILSLRQKVQEKFPECEVHLETRKALSDVAADMYGAGAVNNAERLRPDDDILLVDGAAILTGPAAGYSERERVATAPDGRFVWAYLKKETVREMHAKSAREMAAGAAEKLAQEPTDDILIRHPWDPVRHNAEQIAVDYAALYRDRPSAAPGEGVIVQGDPENLYIGEGVQIQPFTFIDCRLGPVVLDAGVLVRAHSSLQGPCYIGEKTQIFEARIREGTSIGPVCRVGGEVEESIIHACANKYHTGFLGHSYVCEWVNLAAQVCHSDLRTDYGEVTVFINGEAVPTGMLKVGSFIGDHTKTSIGTLLNTGTVAGIMCNLIAGPSLLPRYFPSFSWYYHGRIQEGRGLSHALATARAAMARRSMELSEPMLELIRHSEELTREERQASIERDLRKTAGR